MALKSAYTLVTTALTVASLAGVALAQEAISAVALTDSPRSIELQGGPFNNLSTCTYEHFTRGRMSYWFNISWGDGTISNLQSGQDGESCADIGHHTYDEAGTYDIAVYIGTLGNADQPVPLFSGATVAVVTP